MTIQYFGQSAFKIKAKEVIVFIDPFDPKMLGKSLPKQNDIDILLVTHAHPDHHYLDAISGDYFFIEGPGEYDVKNVSVNGIFSYHDKKKGAERGTNTIYTIDIEGVSLCHLGDLGDILTEEQVERIGNVNVLFIPVGGKYTIDAADAAKIIAQIEPSMVVPMHYGNEKLELQDVDVFLKEMGVEKEMVKNLKVTKDDFANSSDESKVVVMES